MYIPPYNRIAPLLERNDNEALKRLLLITLMTATQSGLLDESYYLYTNEDVRSGIASRRISSALEHFVFNGFYEMRRPRNFVVDEQWYCANYPDVARDIQLGVIPSATVHFNRYGYEEGRAPAPHYKPLVDLWNELLSGQVADRSRVVGV